MRVVFMADEEELEKKSVTTFMSMRGHHHPRLRSSRLGSRENSTTSSIVSKGTETDMETESGTDVSEELPSSSVYLLHNLNEMIKWEKTQPFLVKNEPRRASSSFDKSRTTSNSVKDNRLKSAAVVQLKAARFQPAGGRRNRGRAPNRRIFPNKN